MTPQRRKRRDAWRPPRPRREVIKAVAAGVGVVGLTGAALWLLQPASSPAPTVKPVVPSPSTASTLASTPASTPPTTVTTQSR